MKKSVGMVVIASLVLSLSLSGAVSIAQQSSTLADAPAPTLQARVDALVQQVHLNHTSDPDLLRIKRAQVEAVLGAWNAVERPSQRDRQAMGRWLSASLFESMPGGSGRLPEAPTFVGLPIERANQTVAKPVTPGQESPSRSQASKSEPQRSKWSQHPAAAPLKWTDPFEDDEPSDVESGTEPGGILGPQSGVNPLRNRAPVVVATRPKSRTKSILINHEELTERVGQYNSALRFANLRLLSLEEVDPNELTQIVSDLERLANDRRFVGLYLSALPQDALDRVPAPASPAIVQELARRKAAAALRSLPGDRVEEREELERVSERIAALQY